MIANTTIYYEDAYLNAFLRSQPITVSAYMALYTSAQTDAAPFGEVSGLGYGRAYASKFRVSSNGTTNTGAITFGNPSGDWGNIKGWALWDNALSGNRYMYGSIANPGYVSGSHSSVQFDISGFDLGRTLDAQISIS